MLCFRNVRNRSLIFGYRSFCLDRFCAHRLHFRIQSQAATAGHLNGKFQFNRSRIQNLERVKVS